MTLWVIIPVKPLKRGKSRLASVLNDEERTALNRSLLINTLKTVALVDRIETVLVVSRDPSVLTIAREFSARTVLEDGNPELNTALRRASVVAKAYHANEILVLPADLPLLRTEHINQLLNFGQNPPEVIIAPDRRKDGTNALYINPADLIEFSYGPGSFNIHRSNAEKAGAKVRIIKSDVLGLDLDLPEDLLLLREIENGSNRIFNELMMEE
ncbi:MAG: 2-phospho-L-lactate guanylyltransferase [Chloroflexi bacterium]|nr:2-phospho-L-lactate guanylyltransferase [Chloroflexota bacterium]